MFIILIVSGVIVITSALPAQNYWLNPVSSLEPLNQYHIQDGVGSYRYGYTGPHHARMERRSNGITQGGYSYIDANGILQTVAYLADAENGFRVRASNLPQQPQNLDPSGEISNGEIRREDNVKEFGTNGKSELSQTSLDSKENIFFENDRHKQNQRDTTTRVTPDANLRENDSRNPFVLTGAEASRIEVPKPNPDLLNNEILRKDGNSKNTPIVYSHFQNLESSKKLLTLPNVDRPLVAPLSSTYVLPVMHYGLLHSSLHHAQDSLGQYDYSYVGDTSSKTESRSLDGTTRGAYSYVDANGLLQQVHYVADHNGFRVLATNLPEA